ncbi:MAG: RNA 2',3'-cyclic phosphodiesterase [Acidimicrobiales bacterium]
MRLFVAAWPSAEIVASLQALERPEVPEVRWTTPDQWHVTLRFLGDVDDAAATAANEAVDSIEGGGCRAVVGPATRRLNPSVLVVPVAGLDRVAVEVGRALAGLGGRRADDDRRRFSGHLTLARSARRRPLPKSLAGVAVAGDWPVEEITLVRSHLGRGPARYEIVRRVSLRW